MSTTLLRPGPADVPPAAMPPPGLSPATRPTPARHWWHLPDRADSADLLALLRSQARPARRRADTRPVLLYGAGELGQLALAWCRHNGVAVQAVLDAQPARWADHPAWSTLQPQAPADVPAAWRQQHRLLVCISTLPFAPLQAQLQQQGWLDVAPFYDFAQAWPQAHPMRNGWQADLPAGRHGAALSQVMAAWGDDLSRAHHLQFLAWRCRRQEWTFEPAPVQADARYVIPEFEAAWRPGERVLDGGAHHGQFLTRWCQQHPGWLDQAWLVEPDPEHLAHLADWRATLPEADRRAVQLHGMALGRRSASRHFIAAQGYGSRFWADSPLRVATQALDDLGWSPSLVKLHLEGAEWSALRGGARTLQRHRPLLALTVYHRRDGLAATAFWLQHTLPDYQWLFRLHGWQGTAAVIYGIPHERVSTNA